MTRARERFVEATDASGTLAELQAVLLEATRALGFDYFALLDHPSLTSSDRNLVRIDNYPSQWVRELLTRGYAADDPVHLASTRANCGFTWEDLRSLAPIAHRHRRIINRSHEFGIGAGFTVPANVPGEPSASCSFAVREGGEFPSISLAAAELIGAHALSTARRLRRLPAMSMRPQLSRREVECLRLLAHGKTDWEIATILSISPETVHQYVKRARAAYDVVSRTQLVVHGLRDGWISYEDAIGSPGRSAAQELVHARAQGRL